MSAMSERAASIDALIASMPAEEMKALADRLATQVGYVPAAEPPHPDCPQQAKSDRAAVDYVMAYGGRCRGCADANGVCASSGLPCPSDQARQAIAFVLSAIRYGVTRGYLASPLTFAPREMEKVLADPKFIHLNMLRGGIAKPTPAQAGHLYRGEEARQLVEETKRQNPGAFPDEWAQSPLQFALEALRMLRWAEHGLDTLLAHHVNAGHDHFQQANGLSEKIKVLCDSADQLAWMRPAGVQEEGR